MSFKYICERFGMNFRRGIRVTSQGRAGAVTGATGSCIRVRFDGSTPSVPCPPSELHVLETALQDPTQMEQSAAPTAYHQPTSGL